MQSSKEAHLSREPHVPDPCIRGLMYHMLTVVSCMLFCRAEVAKRRKQRRELSEEQKQEISEAFDLFDANKDKSIDYHELKVNETNNHFVHTMIKRCCCIIC